MAKIEDEFTELVDGDFPRVDLVGKAANGVPRFLIAKSAKHTSGPRGVLEASVVRDLVEKAGTMSDTVAKASGELDAGVVLADAPKGASGDPDEPGSAAWEAIDSATAMKWAAILSRAKNALQVLAGREEMEAFSGAEADGTEGYDLDDACCAIDCAIDLLAPYAVGEKAESDRMADVSKAMVALDADLGQLVAVEGFASIVKAGRVLSAGNEGKIRDAVTSLQQVLSSLPAPMEGSVMKDAVEKDGPVPGTTQAEINGGELRPTVSNETYKPNDELTSPTSPTATSAGSVPVTPADNSVAVPGDVKTLSGLAGSQDDIKGKDALVGDAVVDTGVVTKAAGDAQQIVYSASGKVLGTIDPTKITPVITGDEDEPAAGEAAPEAPAVAPVVAAEEVVPAPSGTTGTPAAEVMKAPMDEVVKAALDEQSAAHAVVVKSLEDRLTALEAPAPSRVLRNGALPPTEMLRGMDQGSGQVDIAKAEELRERLDRTVDARERIAIEKEMNESATQSYELLRSARR